MGERGNCVQTRENGAIRAEKNENSASRRKYPPYKPAYEISRLANISQFEALQTGAAQPQSQIGVFNLDVSNFKLKIHEARQMVYGLQQDLDNEFRDAQNPHAKNLLEEMRNASREAIYALSEVETLSPKLDTVLGLGSPTTE